MRSEEGNRPKAGICRNSNGFGDVWCVAGDWRWTVSRRLKRKDGEAAALIHPAPNSSLFLGGRRPCSDSFDYLLSANVPPRAFVVEIAHASVRFRDDKYPRAGPWELFAHGKYRALEFRSHLATFDCANVMEYSGEAAPRTVSSVRSFADMPRPGPSGYPVPFACFPPLIFSV